jgi:tetratricopeptide (TPR) repeat protein
MSESETPHPQDLKTWQHEARQAVLAAEAAMASREPARMAEALQGCDRVLKVLPPEPLNAETKAPDAAAPLAAERAMVWLWRGRLLVLADKPEAVMQGLQSLDQAIARLKLAKADEGVKNALASAWMNRGSGLFRLGSREALAEAVRSYDQAIAAMELRTGVDANMLGAAWMNRGVGLMHLDAPDEAKESAAARLADAAKALEKAAAVLEPATAAGNAAARRNLASVWGNLGMLRTRREDAAGAVEAHRRGVELFRPVAAQGGAAEVFDLAARVFNLGQACTAAGDADAALEAAREAMELAEGVHLGEPQVVELALRARHAVCVVLGGRLAAGQALAEDPARKALLAEAGDLVEDGLAALKGREDLPDGVAQTAARLYEFGAWLYRTQQPRFLGEFLLEHLGAGEAHARIAAAAVKAARQARVQSGFGETLGGGAEGLSGMLQDLAAVEARLRERAAGAGV